MDSLYLALMQSNLKAYNFLIFSFHFSLFFFVREMIINIAEFSLMIYVGRASYSSLRRGETPA